MEIDKYVSERNQALFSLDSKKIKKFFDKNGIPYSKNPIVFWATVHKAICNIETAPTSIKAESLKWLIEHNMSPDIF